MIRNFSTKVKSVGKPVVKPVKVLPVVTKPTGKSVSKKKVPPLPFKKLSFTPSKTYQRKQIIISDKCHTINPNEIECTNIPTPTVGELPVLEHNLDRVLFSPGVHFLQDPRTRIYNFTPFLKKILPVSKFDFNKITQFITPSKDKTLYDVTKKENLKYLSSTSSMTSTLSQFHYWLSNDRPANITNLSKNFPGLSTGFSAGSKMPAILMCKNQNDVYSVDSDKSADKEILLLLLGHSMEKLLTTSPEEFKKYHIDSQDEWEDKLETYHYSKIADFLMRSQLDCHDDRLPGTGTFDLKTRAVCAVRHDIIHTEKNLTGYKIFKNFGLYESFEREFYELIRSALLKYSLQARIGDMDGIFVCYHNIQHIFGFQYLSLQDIDYIFHSFDDKLRYKDVNNFKPHDKLEISKIQGPIGFDSEDENMQLSSYIAENEFKASVKIWSDIMGEIVKKLDNSSFRLIVRNDPLEKELHFIALPMTNDQIDKIQEFGAKSTTEEVEGHNKIAAQRLRFQQVNQDTADNCIGFKITRAHFFNGVQSNQVYYKPKLSDKWEIKYDIDEISAEESSKLYLKYLEEKELISFSNTDDMNEQISEYLQILRAYGDKGKLREEIWKEGDEKLNVWEPIKNDKNV